MIGERVKSEWKWEKKIEEKTNENENCRVKKKGFKRARHEQKSYELCEDNVWKLCIWCFILSHKLGLPAHLVEFFIIIMFMMRHERVDNLLSVEKLFRKFSGKAH